MCSILIKARHTNLEPTCQTKIYKRGDPVVVFDDGHVWGDRECLPDFVVINITGVSAAAAQTYLAAHDDAGGEMLSRRLWQFEIDRADIPAWVKNSLRDTGQVTVTWNQIRNFIRNKVSGAKA